VPGDTGVILGEALVFACFSGRRACVELLLARGADIDARPHPGLTGLHFAVIADRPETIRDGIYGGTPLGWATYNDKPGVAPA
jgi:hypothetical protein